LRNPAAAGGETILHLYRSNARHLTHYLRGLLRCGPAVSSAWHRIGLECGAARRIVRLMLAAMIPTELHPSALLALAVLVGVAIGAFAVRCMRRKKGRSK
jgi:hypothetical protein